MNSHQRRKWMVEKHMRFPLGSEVIVWGHRATIFKHHKESPHICTVHFNPNRPFSTNPQDWARVPIGQLKPVKRLKVRPWWRVHNDEARKSA